MGNTVDLQSGPFPPRRAQVIPLKKKSKDSLLASIHHPKLVSIIQEPFLASITERNGGSEEKGWGISTESLLPHLSESLANA